MKLASTSLCIVAASAAAFFAGCAKKPVRPDPSATALGPQSGNAGALTPSEVSVAPDTTLQPRADGSIDDGNTIRGLLQPVYFDFDRHDVKASELPRSFRRQRTTSTRTRSTICWSRATATGGERRNTTLGLGDRRASAAKKYLPRSAVAPDKVETLSKGSEEAAKNADDATRAKDRRDELVVVKKP